MKKALEQKPVWLGVGTGYLLLVVFVLLERCLLDLSYRNNWALIDAAIRLCFGAAGLLMLRVLEGDRFFTLFRPRIEKRVLPYLVPIPAYFLFVFLLCFCAREMTSAYATGFLMMCAAEVATGFWEETAARGLVMSGMLRHWRSTAKGRVLSILLTGLLFGSLHVLSFLYGKGLVSCLWSGLYTCCWGMFIAAIYLLSDNLLLVMAIHTVWNIVVKIPDYFFINGYVEGSLLTAIGIGQDIIHLGVLPALAIVIGVRGSPRPGGGAPCNQPDMQNKT